MPLWKIYHPVGAFSAQDKKEFAEKVTAMYSRIPIPKFYVVMIFEEVAAESLYVGGASHGKFIRLKPGTRPAAGGLSRCPREPYMMYSRLAAGHTRRARGGLPVSGKGTISERIPGQFSRRDELRGVSV